MEREGRDLTKRLIRDREQRSESALLREQETARRERESQESEAAAYQRAFFELGSLAGTLLDRQESRAELAKISTWKPRPMVMEKLFPSRPEEVAAWELARGLWGPYHPHHDIPVDTYDACRVMVSVDGRLLYGAVSSVGQPEKFEAPTEYTVVSDIDERLRARLAACGLRTVEDLRRKAAAIRG
jgi:hypothetical protein